MLASLLYLGHSGLFQFQVEISKLKNSIASHMVDILTLKINVINIKYYGTNLHWWRVISMNNNNTNNTKEIPMSKTKEIVISRNKNMEMVVIQTPLKGIKNRKGEQAISSETKHRKIKKGNK